MSSVTLNIKPKSLIIPNNPENTALTGQQGSKLVQLISSNKVPMSVPPATVLSAVKSPPTVKLVTSPTTVPSTVKSPPTVKLVTPPATGTKLPLNIITSKVTIPSVTPPVSNPDKQYRITASAYQKYDSTRDHIYNITDTYIGSDEQMPRQERILNLDTMTFTEQEIHLPEGVERLFVEISSNAGDNVARSLKHKINPGEVTIKMDRHTISVRNGGIPIPIEIHPEEKVWAPEMIFGMLHSSSNYDKTKIRTECGRNGYGAKLTNIFSKQFMVTIGDPHNKKWYRQIWSNNMLDRSEPEIKEYTGEAFVEIVYVMDFKRFGYEYYPDEAFKLYARHAADMSFTGKVPVSFNGIKLNVRKSRDYAKLYLGDLAKQSIVYYQWPANTPTIEKKGVQYATEEGSVPIIEICAVDTPDTAINVSFVNGMWTRNGGVHADAAFKAVATSILHTVNGDNKSNKTKKSRVYKLNLGDVKRHVSMFVSCWIGDPKFDSQAKAMLKSPTPKISIDEKILQPIMKWSLVDRLYAELEAKHFKASLKTDGKKSKYLHDLKGEDANDAGTANSHNCTLYVTEGKSALGFATKMLSLFERGRNFIGLLPLKGKPLNVMNAPPTQVEENTEIIEIKKMLGLRSRVDYLVEENFQTLRYGHLMILADADTDGKHILGLVLNFFHCKFPTLLARGYVKYLRTKIVEVTKGNQVIKFYNNHEYDNWKQITPNYESWDHRYFKGLGSSKDSDIADEFRAPKIVQCFYDDLAPMAMQLAFHQKLADQRKDWIKNWQPDFKVEEMVMQPISAFINYEFIQFSIADISRSIPRFMDGLKHVQRKVVWGSMSKWSGAEKNWKPVKVANLASYIAEKTEYHHGGKSMGDTITHMVQDFLGSNNLPYLVAEGQFGSLNMLGADAADPRYTATKPKWWWRYIYKVEDNPLLDMVVDEGKICEPVTFLPIIPMQLVNGGLGIGTGHSTFLPNHDPLDICQWITAKIKGYALPSVLPWYRGFKGTIKIIERVPKNKKLINIPSTPSNNDTTTPSSNITINETDNNEGDTEDDTDNTEDNNDGDDEILENDNIGVTKNTKYTMVTMGVFTVTGNKRKTVVVTELPIGRSIHDYNSWLLKQKENKVISGYSNYSTHDTVHFEITGMKNPSLKNLRLIKSFGMSNMVLLDTNNRPVKYDSANDILESFYALRLPYYQKRKDNILKEKQDKINLLHNKIRFIIAVIGGYNLVKSNPNITIEEVMSKGCILSLGLTKKQIQPQMEKLNFPADLLQKVTLHHCTHEEIEKSKTKLEQLIQEKDAIDKISPSNMWQSDIDEFMAAYCKEYKCGIVNKNVKLNIKKV